MRALIQRTTNSKVEIDEQVVGQIGSGLCVFIGVESEDDKNDLDWVLKKIINMRIFSDADGKMNLSLLDISGALLIISQFTLHASTKKGNRPSFIQAAPPKQAESLYDQFVDEAKLVLGSNRVANGEFGADMKVSILNDGPVTIWLDSKLKT